MFIKKIRKSGRTKKKINRWVDDELSGIELGGNKDLLENARNKNFTKNNTTNKNNLDEYKLKEYRLKEYMRRLPNLEYKKNINQYNIIDIDNSINKDIIVDAIMIGIPHQQIIEPIMNNIYNKYTVLTFNDYNNLLDEMSNELPFDKNAISTN